MPVEIRVQYPDLYFASQLPALNKLTNKEYDLFPPQFPRYFNVQSSSRSIEQDTGVGDIGLLVEVPENGKVQYDTLQPSFPKTYTHLDYNRGYALSHQLQRDDKFGLADAHAKGLGRSGRITPEILAASHFLNGFSGSFNGPDGKPLFATDHPKESGGTQSNRPASGVDLSIFALEQGIIAMRGLTSDKGKLLMLPPDELIVPPSLMFRASEILRGTMRSDTANNTINAFRNISDMGSFQNFSVWDYVASAPRAWYLKAKTSLTGLKYYWRERPALLTHFEFESRAAKSALWMACSSGWSFWQGTYGSPGGGS